MRGSLEYSDFPMDEATFGVKHEQYIPGPVVHEYLHRYAGKFDIYRRIRFESKVDSVVRQAIGGWIVNVVPADKSDGSCQNIFNTTRLLTRKLVVATGMTSEPFLPDFAGSESFDAPLFHCKDFPEHANNLFRSAKSVVVLGGSKFAYDTVCECASKGLEVEWVIRKSGYGPCWLIPSRVTPFKLLIDKLITMRCLSWLSPCTWGEADGFGYLRHLLHGTRVGRWIVDSFWAQLGNDVLKINGYDKHPETEKLKPWASPFWHATDVSILNCPTDIFELVRSGAVRVHIEDISHLSSKTVHLSSNTSLRTDALICSTGWQHRPPVKFLPEGDEALLGLPYRSMGPEEDIVQTADNEILKRFPSLRSPPDVFGPSQIPLTGKGAPASLNRPFRLYRFIVPPAFLEDRSIAYAGMLLSFLTALNAQTQALWLTAYLEGKLSLDRLKDLDDELNNAKPFGTESVEWDTILHSQFCKWRSPAGKGCRFPDFAFDSIPYLDRLMKDLGLEHRRKSGLLAECFSAYGPEDYRGIVDEWRTKVSKNVDLLFQSLRRTYDSTPAIANRVL